MFLLTISMFYKISQEPEEGQKVIVKMGIVIHHKDTKCTEKKE